MDGRPELDFWGLTRHYAMRSHRFGGAKAMVPEHIQSHVVVVRSRMMADFFAYWQMCIRDRLREVQIPPQTCIAAFLQMVQAPRMQEVRTLGAVSYTHLPAKAFCQPCCNAQ